MGDYADAGYRLQHYKITFYGELEGNWLNFKTYHRAFRQLRLCTKVGG